jgi:hypothetical protein
MPLDPRIILSLSEINDQNRARNIQQQQADTNGFEAQVRAAELQQRMQELRDAAMRKNQPAAYDPKKADEELTYQTHLGDTIHGQLVAAQKDPTVWPVARQTIARLAGPQAIADLPEDWNQAAPIVDTHIKSWAGQKAEIQGKTEMIEVPDPSDPTKTIRQVVQLTPGATFPGTPQKATKATDEGDLTKSSLDVQGAAALKAGDMDAYKRLLKVKKEMGQADDKAPAATGTNDALVASIFANPSLYATLPPTTKKALIPALDKMGFDFAAAGAGKPATQDQSNAAGYARRMEDAEDTIKAVQKDIAGMGLLSFTAQSNLPPKGQSSSFQQYDQSARNFINAVLRRESGAAISQSEFDNARRQYLPQPGDKPETLELKRKNRETTLGNLIAAGGPAYKPREKAKAAPKTVGRFTVEVE